MKKLSAIIIIYGLVIGLYFPTNYPLINNIAAIIFVPLMLSPMMIVLLNIIHSDIKDR